MNENAGRINWERAACTGSRFRKDNVVFDRDVDWKLATNKTKGHANRKNGVLKLLGWICFSLGKTTVRVSLDIVAYTLFWIFNFIWYCALFLVGWLMTLCPAFALLFVPVAVSYYVVIALISMFSDFYWEKFNGHYR
jgi:hypothetical protein